MKVTITETGVITLTPETSVEAYALRQWADQSLVSVNDMARAEQCYWRGSRLVVAAAVQLDAIGEKP